ncbi:hypothetical protein CHS0354_021538 [Potamilus streckersoni]|uniref:RWD domain-containing protein n=1 Tax=Potamilus streckersoni TaxID=2493646 RepID=A0AAE0SPG2_9BIVA|nr:hypothetical protein CHS0354_021538 [Potamilus streckersoni]
MTDHREDQKHEIEALESIYPSELEVLSRQPFHEFQINLTSQSEDTDVDSVSCTLHVLYVEKYPDEAPIVEIRDPENLDDIDIQTLNDLIQQKVEENLGMAMVFTLISVVQEKLSDIAEDTRRKQEEEKEKKKKMAEEVERKRFDGTRVTVENFLAWKTKFDVEIAEIKRAKYEMDLSNKKLTGKEMFLRDASMNESDVKFLQEVDTIEVDESLFQDMDDLDLEDELLETED